MKKRERIISESQRSFARSTTQIMDEWNTSVDQGPTEHIC